MAHNAELRGRETMTENIGKNQNSRLKNAFRKWHGFPGPALMTGYAPLPKISLNVDALKNSSVAGTE